MINIKQLNISSDLKNIIVKIESSNLQAKFIKMYLWNIHTFRDYEKVLDISYLLNSKSNVEDLIISSEQLKIPLFSGIYFIEFRTNEEPSYDLEGQPSNQSLGVVANLFKYKECLLNKTLSVEVSGCGKIKNECTDCQENLCLLNTFINTLDTSIVEGYLEEAVKIAKDIESLCEICHTCPNYGDTISYNGKGLMYQIIDNTILNQPVKEEDDDKDIIINECNPSLPESINGFIPLYIKYFDNGEINQDIEGPPPCYLIDENCFKEIAYLYLPDGTKNWDFERYDLLYTKPEKSFENLVKPLEGQEERFFVFQNLLQNSIFTSSSENFRQNDLGVIYFDKRGQRLDYVCCGCPS